MDKIKIVFLLGSLTYDGTQKQIVELIRRLDRQRFECAILAFQCQGRVRDEVEAFGIPFECLNFSGLRGKFRWESYWELMRMIIKMWRYFKMSRPQIVQSFLFWTNIYGTLAAKLAGVPVIMTGRRTILDHAYMKPCYHRLQNMTNRGVTAIVANAHNVKANCCREERGISPDRVVVIPNGIDAALYPSDSPRRQQLRRAFQITENMRVIGVIGTLSRYKGHRTVLEAAALVLPEYPALKWFFIGRDEGLQTELEAFAERLHLRHAVMFTGERCDIPDLLAMLDIQISASSIEGLSNAILEGMAAGKPIIATNVGGTPELILHQATGWLIPPNDPEALADALKRLLQDSDLCATLGQAARQRAQELFSVEQMVQQSEALYAHLVGNTAAQP